MNAILWWLSEKYPLFIPIMALIGFASLIIFVYVTVLFGTGEFRGDE